MSSVLNAVQQTFLRGHHPRSAHNRSSAEHRRPRSLPELTTATPPPAIPEQHGSETASPIPERAEYMTGMTNINAATIATRDASRQEGRFGEYEHTGTEVHLPNKWETAAPLMVTVILEQWSHDYAVEMDRVTFDARAFFENEPLDEQKARARRPRLSVQRSSALRRRQPRRTLHRPRARGARRLPRLPRAHERHHSPPTADGPACATA